MNESDNEEKLGIVVDEIGGEEVAAKQIAEFFLRREEQHRKESLEQRRIILAEQKAMRFRWCQGENT